MSTLPAHQAFPATHWSVVLAAVGGTSPESAHALEALCRNYWYPLYDYARRCGHSVHDAEDLTQEFFCRLLEKRWLESADPAKGRLRTFLIVALKRFMAKEWRRASAGRRGGGQVHIPVDTVFAETRFATSATNLLPAEEAFDQQWALTLLDLTVNRLQAEFNAAGKPGDFIALKNTLTAAHGAIDYATIAASLGISQGAARVAVHRLRKRFRELFREEISQTLAQGADLEDEVRYLATALAKRNC